MGAEEEEVHVHSAGGSLRTRCHVPAEGGGGRGAGGAQGGAGDIVAIESFPGPVRLRARTSQLPAQCLCPVGFLLSELHEEGPLAPGRAAEVSPRGGQQLARRLLLVDPDSLSLEGEGLPRRRARHLGDERKEGVGVHVEEHYDASLARHVQAGRGGGEVGGGRQSGLVAARVRAEHGLAAMGQQVEASCAWRAAFPLSSGVRHQRNVRVGASHLPPTPTPRHCS
mmetsp:Transcript_23126/g.75245  ORF Transcript_23126/g.75245 Transcript_23126/m.75245 type:complete len:225 (+) Transcript_23126:69-743(+)